MWGEKNLKVISTEYFDFIYSEKSRTSALILAEKADSIYKELAENYNVPHKFHFPVVMVPTTDTFNAYYSYAPFNHIVIFDTSPIVDMAVFSESLIMVFKHELTHAITMNASNVPWYKFRNIMGSAYYPGIATTTRAILEGAAVSQESKHGEGRLNDEYSKQIVKQAKIENKFPKHASIQGSRDMYPYAKISYMFGSEFAKYLRQTYGEQKYALYWNYLINWKGLTFDIVFKKVYGISEKRAWNEFCKQYEIPMLQQRNSEALNKTSYYTSLVTCKTGIAYVDLFNASVYFCKKESDNSLSKPKKLFTANFISSISISKDGRFLTVNYTDESTAHPTDRSMIFDLFTKQKYVIKQKHIKNSIVIGGKYVATVKKQGYSETLEIYELNFNKYKRICGTTLKNNISPDFADQFFSLTSDDTNLYYIFKEKLNFFIGCYELNEEKFIHVKLPFDDMRIRDLSFTGENAKLSFSYTKKGSMPRFGFVEFDQRDGKINYEGKKAIFTLSTKDCSGGYYCPVKITEGKIAFIAEFFESHKVMFENFDNTNMETISSALEKPDFLKSKNKQEPTFNVQSFTEKNFNIFKYSLRGSIFPVSIASLQQITPELFTKSYAAPFGITYFTSSPWTSPIILVSCGYSILSNSGSFLLNLSGGTATDVFKYRLISQIGFDKNGFKQTFNEVSLKSEIPIGSTWFFNIAEETSFFFGQQCLTSQIENKLLNLFIDKNLATDFDSRLLANSSTIFGFSNLRRHGTNAFEKYGIQMFFLYNFQYYNQIPFKTNKSVSMFSIFSQNLSFTLKGAIPYLIPIQSQNGFTYNLPITLSTSIFPSVKYFGRFFADVVLFAYELQVSPDWLTILYFNRISVSASYTGNIATNTAHSTWFFDNIASYKADISSGNIAYHDDLCLALTLSATPNIGVAANTNAKFDLSLRFHYRPNREINTKMFSMDLSGLVLF
ncbi:MAG: hypothetical protein ACTTHG_06410 [Treponemataceae bacterium]